MIGPVDLTGRIGLVTGASRGLGRAIAEAMAGSGATVVAVARTEVAGAPGGDHGPGRIIPMTCDVADVDAVMALGERVAADVGPVSMLVNAAGVFGQIELIARTDPHAWVRTIMVDAVASYLTVRAFLPGMLDAGWGRIVNLTSAASLHPPGPLNSAYGTAKVALNQFTRHLAAEIAGTGVTANVIHPGDVQTAMWADIRDQVTALGPVAADYQAWVDWVAETGGDPPQKAVDLVLRLISDQDGVPNGEFCWIDDPLQAPIASWDPPSGARPWLDE